MATREVPLRTKILYGVGDAAISIKNSSINRFLLFFYTDVVHLAPATVGAILLLGKLWDAITDPAMGYVSDATRSRWGRRRPYVLLSAVPIGVCYYFLFTPPALSPEALRWYLLALNLLLFTAFTVFAVPYLAWGAELARDYHERTEVVQVRALFGVVGGVLGAMLPMLIATRFADQRIGFAWMAVVLGAAIAATGLVTGFGVRDRGRERLPVPGVAHFLRGLARTFANRDFRVIFATFCLMTLSAAVGEAVQMFVVKYWLDMVAFFPWIALTFGLSFAGSFPLWLGLSRRIGKQRAMLVGLGGGCVAPFGWLVVQPGQHALMLAFMVVAGTLSGSLTLVVSQAIDIVDLDELQTGEQRAGTYFGIWALGLKTMGALGSFLGGALLAAVGYVPDVPQSADTIWWLLMIVGPVQAGVFLIGLLIFRRMRFDAADLRRVQAELEARRAARLVP